MCESWAVPSTDPSVTGTVTEASGLDAMQLDAIVDLERRVVAHDGGRLKLEHGVLRDRPAGEVHDLLVWDGATLVGFCGIYAFGADPEIAGAIDPACRRRGIGSALLARALGLLAARGSSRALLVTPRATDSGRRFAIAHGAALDHSEHHLELDGDPVGPPPPSSATAGVVVRRAAEADGALVREILADAFGDVASEMDTAPSDVHFVVERAGTVVGTLRLDVGMGTAGIYGFAVRSSVRGQGIGRAALYEVCVEARRRGARTVTLEVDVDNDHALGLYTSVGFERRTTEDYYALAVAR